MNESLRIVYLGAVLLLGACANNAGLLSARDTEERQRIETLFNDPVRMEEAQKEALQVFGNVAHQHREKHERGEFTLPKVKRRFPPEYPEALRKKRLQGVVWMGFVIGTDGSVEKVEALGDSSPEFIDLAKAAIQKWKFVPATSNGVPVRSLLVQPLTFTLQ